MEKIEIKKNLEIKSYGVSTSRYRSGLLREDHMFLVPLGPNMIEWDLKIGIRTKFIPCSQSAIMCLLQNANYIVSLSYNGEINIFDTVNLKKLNRFYCSEKHVRHASLNNNFLLTNAERGENKGIAEIWNLKNIDSVSSAFNLKGRYRFGEMGRINNIFVMKKNKLTELESSKSKKKIFNYFAETYKYENENFVSDKSIHLEKMCEIIASAINKTRNIVALLYSDRTIIVINIETLEIFLNLTLNGSGCIMTLNFQDDHLFLFPKTGLLMEIKCDKPIEILNLALEEIKSENINITKFKSPAFQMDSYFFCFDDFSNIISFNGEGLHYYDFQKNKTKTISTANLTLCGLAINDNETMFAVGDFGGNVYIYSTIFEVNPISLFLTNLMNPIRSILWIDSKDRLIIGCMDGSLYQWIYLDTENEPILLSNLDGSITAIKLINLKEKEFILASTTSGSFYVFSEYFELITYHKGHLPQIEHDKEAFGSLGKFAEIWSVTWNPLNYREFATCSEDQTCCIWKMEDKNSIIIEKLTGHTKAVTCVDWQIMNKDLGNIFVSCSDDQSFRIYQVIEGVFNLKETVFSSFIKEWHTLTYLALEKQGTRLAIAAQNGFVFIYDIINKKFDFAERIFMGSCEGLVWIKSKIIICSADLTISLIEL